jgi:hypothetical protein
MKFRLLMCALVLVTISGTSQVKLPLVDHPNTKGWDQLFNDDLSNAEFTPNVWTIDKGVFSADKDQMIFSKVEFENFVLDLEFNMEAGANSGIIVYCTDKKNWIPHSIEIQISDDTWEKFAEWPGNWKCGSVFGHVAPSEKVGRKPGEWNRMTIACKGKSIDIVLNGKPVATMDMSKFTNAKTNPDGSEIPSWLTTPCSELTTKGFIGLQGKHAGAKTYFRNVKIRKL